MDETIFLLADWDSQYCMHVLSILHMRKYYAIKPKIQDPYTPLYMEALLGEHTEEYHKAVYDEFQSLIRRGNVRHFQRIYW